ncbi:MAG: hypothetical protein J5771_06295 [Bacteroidales bacterium]|nr:hypothetical protein [Bacteroidales bacterium]
MASGKKINGTLKDILVAFAATTLSIVLTFGTTMAINRVNQKKERRLTALMVMGSIEQFAREVENTERYLAPIDSIATWLVGLPLKDVAKLGDEHLIAAYHDALNVPMINRDKTAETIFSSNIDTWKNMGNFQFIDNVGQCFSIIGAVESYFNNWSDELVALNDAVYSHPDEYPGKSKIEKLLRNEQLLSKFRNFHSLRGWLRYAAANLRMENRRNMSLIGISEKEVMDFTDNMGAADQNDEVELNQYDFRVPEIDPDSLAAQLSYARNLN